MEKNVKIAMLLDIYGNMLTEKQFKLLDDYYNNDLSLSEIAENEGITRQAVRDNLKKGENNLFEYETKLEFMKKSLENEKIVSKILVDINKIKKNNLNIEAIEILNNIKKNIRQIN